jgi:hypothetical protein
MSLFRPTLKVTDPRGREWEIYVSRYATPKWQPGSYTELSDHPFGGIALVGWLVEIPLFLYHDILAPAARFLVATPYRALTSRHSRTIWIEAIAWGVTPRREAILWTTTPDHAGRVLEQIADGLASGDVAQPLGSVFRGRSRS